MASLDDVRRIGLTLPEAADEAHFERNSLRVAGKIFCTFAADEPRIVLKFTPEDQHNLVSDDPAALSPVKGAWGKKGWTNVDLARLKEERLAMLLRLAWTTVAPKRLLKASPPA